MKLEDMNEVLAAARAGLPYDSEVWFVLDKILDVVQGLVDRQLTTAEDTPE